MNETRILVVDDDPAILRLCQRILERHGFMVQTAASAKEALLEAEKSRYDLLITDIRMPLMDGFELASRFRHIHSDSAIILITGFGSVETSIQALRKGVDGLLVKPFESSKELIETVTHVLENRRIQQDAARLKVLRPLFEIIEQIYSLTDYDALTGYLKKLTKDMFNVTESGVYRFEDDDHKWKLVFGIDLNSYIQPHQLDFDQIVNDLSNGYNRIIQTFQLNDYVLRNFLNQKNLEIFIIPVFRNKSRYLLYFLCPHQLGKLSEADLEMMAIFSRQAVIAMENAVLYQNLEKMIIQSEETHKAMLMAEKMGALGRLMGSLAHEMNNPLQAVRNCLHLSLREDITREQQREYLNLASMEIERLSSLAQNTLTFYRGNDFERKRSELIPVIELVIELVKPQLQEQGIELICDFPAQSIQIEMVQSQIQQIILNGLLNSMEALKDQPSPRKIWLEIDNQNPRKVILSIEDNGRGIPPELEEKVFEPFFSTRQGGTGLGLSVCYELVVDVHQGDIRFVPPLHGNGARLQITLPTQG